MLKFIVLFFAFLVGLRLLARFFLKRFLGQVNTSQRFDPYSSMRNSRKTSSKPDFDRIQDADYEDITEPEKD